MNYDLLSERQGTAEHRIHNHADRPHIKLCVVAEEEDIHWKMNKQNK